MKIAITADLQAHDYPGYSTPGLDGVPSRLRDICNCIDWMVEEARREKCEMFVINGDLFESREQISISVIDTVCRTLHAAQQRLGYDPILIPGNHDSLLRSSRLNSLQMFRGYAKVFENPTAYRGFGFVPWNDDPKEIAAGVDYVLAQGAEVLFAHYLVEGAVNKAAETGALDVLQPKRFRQIFLGDVHDPVQITPRCRYVGSPLQLKYSDAGKHRGFVIYDAVKDKVKYIENPVSPRFHLIESKSDLKEVKPKDHVRLQVPDKELIEHVAAWSEKTRINVEYAVDTADLEDPQQTRLAIADTDDYTAVLEQYVRFRLPDADKNKVASLVKLGMEYVSG
jgi:DNA repair exonuclease SbcCD nuclease subunit